MKDTGRESRNARVTRHKLTTTAGEGAIRPKKGPLNPADIRNWPSTRGGENFYAKMQKKQKKSKNTKYTFLV